MAVEGVEKTIAAWSYEGGPRALVLALKLRGTRSAAEPLADAIAAACRRVGIGARCVTWVPARRADVRRRGFDHAEVLARGVAQRLGLSAARLLFRRGEQADQAGLTRVERLANLAGAFSATPAPLTGVLLVDDLVTTGATARACAAALAAVGCRPVELATACSVAPSVSARGDRGARRVTGA